MRQLKTSLKLLYRNRFFSLFILAGFLGYFGFQIQDLIRYHSFTQPGFYTRLSPLRMMLWCSIYLFVFFLFLSYEYFSKLKSDEMEEAAGAADGGIIHTQAAQFTVLAGLLGILSICEFLLLWGIAVGDGVATPGFLGHIAKNVLLYILLIGLLATFIGWAFSFLKNRLAGYAGLLLAAVLVSPVPEYLGEGFMLSTDVNLFPFLRLIQFLPSGLSWAPNTAAGFSVLPYQFAAVAFWCFLFGGVILYRLFWKRGRMKTLAVASGLLACVCLVSYALEPAAPLFMNGDPDSGRNHDEFYYVLHKTPQKQQAPTFHATGYTMKLDIGSALQAQVKVRVDETQLPEYAFTLYHGYKVNRVLDESGRSLPFLQEGDYVTVKNEPRRPRSQIVFTYQGFSALCYSNPQGVCLPGYFPYYPRPGFFPLDNVETVGKSFLSVDTAALSEFDVSVNCRQTVYSNAQEVGKGHFKARTDCLTLVAGLYRTNTIQSTRFVYPYLFEDADVPVQQWALEQMKALEAREDSNHSYQMDHKTVLLLPMLQQDSHQYFFHNQVITTGLGLGEAYARQLGISSYTRESMEGGAS